jgi:hypothetical protein
MFFTFPEDARWSAERQAEEYGVEIGEYRGVVRVPRRVLQRLLPERPTPRAVRRGVLHMANPVGEQPERMVSKRLWVPNSFPVCPRWFFGVPPCDLSN